MRTVLCEFIYQLGSRRHHSAAGYQSSRVCHSSGCGHTKHILFSAMTPVHQLGVLDILLLVAGLWILTKIGRRLTSGKTGTKLNGPPSDNYIFGVNRRMAQSTDGSLVFQGWAAEYGPVFQLPTGFGGHRTILCDPKAVNHFYSMERSIYIKSKLGRAVISSLVLCTSFRLYLALHNHFSLVAVCFGRKEMGTRGLQKRGIR